MAHKNLNLIWLKPLMGDLKLIELFLHCDICGGWWQLGLADFINSSKLIADESVYEFIMKNN